MKKIEQVKKRLAAIEVREKELLVLMKPFQEKLAPFQKETGLLWEESRKLKELLDELAFEPSLQYILGGSHARFHYIDNDKNCSYHRMNKFISNNYKYLKVSGYNPKTNVYAVEFSITTGADAKEVTQELAPAIKLALKAGQDNFHLFTDDLSASGIPMLTVKDNKYEVGKTTYGSHRTYNTSDTLLGAVKFCLDNKLTYTRG